MASDNLNQIGKYIKDTRDTADYAISRYSAKRNTVERVRDTFTPTNSFLMKFKTRENHENAVIDLRFDKPPPLSFISPIATKALCESFTISTSAVPTAVPRAPTGLVAISGNTEINLMWSIVPTTVDYEGRYLTLSYSYIVGSVTVYINGVAADSSQYVETDPSAGGVYVNGGPRATNTVVICYMYVV
jgi:hypothetical protein